MNDFFVVSFTFMSVVLIWRIVNFKNQSMKYQRYQFYADTKVEMYVNAICLRFPSASKSNATSLDIKLIVAEISCHNQHCSGIFKMEKCTICL